MAPNPDHLPAETDLRRALENREFELHYQPKVSCASGEIVGAEALLCWKHPTRGLLSAAELLPLLEDRGLVELAGEWTLREACSQLKRWLDDGLAMRTLAVNLSARQLAGGQLVKVVREVLASSALPAGKLELELTEDVLMRNVEQVIPILAELRSLGVKLIVDDFGTGYSSLSYLKHFPLDAVKIDRSFVQDIAADPDEASITRAIIAMARNLKLKVIADGVDTGAQLALLIANQCDEIQGALFSVPVPAAEMAKMLIEKRSLPLDAIRPTTRQRTILLVDDEENILASLRRLLRRDGYRILTAGGGAQGLEVLEQEEVDVVVSDQRMPGMTGVEFLRRVKTSHPQTVRIVLSGYTELQSITDAINEGAIYKFLTKPWEDELLRSNIAEAFHHKELADENRRLSNDLQVSNRKLADANLQLQQLLEEKQRQLQRGEVTLDIVQEVLQCVPLPIVGFDDEDMVVFANIEADTLFGQGMALIGTEAGELMPGPLLELIHGNDGDARNWSCGTRRFRAIYRCIGHQRGAQGRLLLLTAEGVA